MAYDFTAIKRAADMVSLIGGYVQLKKDGPHYKGCCPFHNEDTASFAVTPGKYIWKCFGCGKGGDIVDFFVQLGSTYSEAIAIVSGDQAPPLLNQGAKIEKIEPPPDEWEQDVPAFWPKNFWHPRYGEPVKTWEYRDGNGIIISYDCRFEYEDEKGIHKDVLPLTFCSNGDKSEWRWRAMDKPRRLYNLDQLALFPNKPVIIVEGRKTAEAAEQLVSNPIVVTWQGGGKAIQYTDWAPLFGRPGVTIWQDNDHEGYLASLKIAEILQGKVKPIKFAHNPKASCKGWDAADALAEGWTRESAKRYLNQNLHDEPQEIKKPEKPESKVDTPGGISQNTIQTPPLTTDAAQLDIGKDEKGISENSGGDAIVGSTADNGFTNSNSHFRFLGFQNNEGKLVHCFYNYTTKTIVKVGVSQMSKGAALLELAPLNFWEHQYPKQGSGWDIASSANWLINTSQGIGIFRPDSIRGRGAWMEDEVPVIHTGDRLIVRGETMDISRHHSRFIYEQGMPMGLDVIDPLHRNEARKLVEIAGKLRWGRQVDAFLFAGWCVVAPVCGALKWRPHIWITGPAGSGKTWIINKIMLPALGGTALHVQGNTSEAGVRQSLKRDARPVLFDEAEAEDQRAQDRVQSVLGLMRSASAEDGGNIIKGTASAGADSYQIRSCFAFASIAMQIAQQSDRTRLTVLNLNGHGDNEKDKSDADFHFHELLKLYSETTKHGYFTKLRARTILLLPIILKNAHTFSMAAASVLGVQRTGDQLGSLIAGAYSLVCEDEVDYESAVEWLRNKDWDQEKSLVETRDERRLFNRIMEHQTPVEGQFGQRFQRTIAELVSIIAKSNIPDVAVTVPMAKDALGRTGVKVDLEKHQIVIANQSRAMKLILKDSNWGEDYPNILSRISGAGKTQAPTSFAGVKSRGTTIPIAYLLD